jgi:hypothetical protein
MAWGGVGCFLLVVMRLAMSPLHHTVFVGLSGAAVLIALFVVGMLPLPLRASAPLP